MQKWVPATKKIYFLIQVPVPVDTRTRVLLAKMLLLGKVYISVQESHLEQLLTLQKFAKFSGSSDKDFSIWFDDFNETIKISNLTEREKINKIKTFLSGEASYTFEGFNHDTINTLQEAGSQMKRVFDFARDTQDWLVKIYEVKKANTESIRVFAYQVNRMVKKAFPDVGEISKVSLAVDYFLRGLQQDIGNKLIQKHAVYFKFDNIIQIKINFFVVFIY